VYPSTDDTNHTQVHEHTILQLKHRSTSMHSSSKSSPPGECAIVSPVLQPLNLESLIPSRNRKKVIHGATQETPATAWISYPCHTSWPAFGRSAIHVESRASPAGVGAGKAGYEYRSGHAVPLGKEIRALSPSLATHSQIRIGCSMHRGTIGKTCSASHTGQAELRLWRRQRCHSN